MTPEIPMTGAAPVARWRRWIVPVVTGIVALELLWIGLVLGVSLGNPSFGLDYRWHMEASKRLIETGTPYWPWQLNGPYEIGNGAILYPPVAFALFIPFLWLPAVAWWIVPMAITVWAMTRHRPPLWTWPVTIGLFCLEKSLNVYVFGNPTMWIVAAVAAGTVWGWPFVLVLAKPTFAPLALLGIRRRSWWVALAIFALVAALFGRLWFDWISVAVNSDVSIAYNLPTLPLILAPLLPWLADPKVRSRNRNVTPRLAGREVAVP
jgi:hypothetical protein